MILHWLNKHNTLERSHQSWGYPRKSNTVLDQFILHHEKFISVCLNRWYTKSVNIHTCDIHCVRGIQMTIFTKTYPRWNMAPCEQALGLVFDSPGFALLHYHKNDVKWCLSSHFTGYSSVKGIELQAPCAGKPWCSHCVMSVETVVPVVKEHGKI